MAVFTSSWLPKWKTKLAKKKRFILLCTFSFSLLYLGYYIHVLTIPYCSFIDEHGVFRRRLEVSPNYTPTPGANLTRTHLFKILFWTDFYGSDPAQMKEFVRSECNEFFITSSKSEKNADVIVFSYLDIPNTKKFPPSRDPNVPWIAAVKEASIHHPLQVPEIYNGIFNWTWGSRSDSLIHTDFMDIFERNEKPDERWKYGSNFSRQFLRNKTNLAAWVVSNCHVVKSKRNELVRQLSRMGIQIHKYGRCGNPCSNSGDGGTCFENLGKFYKFYMALENALCEDYITEKIYHGLNFGMVPIVYALGNVKNVAPPNSFINILDFPTLKALAERLNYLDNNPQEYFKYFEWRQSYKPPLTKDKLQGLYHCSMWKKMWEFKMKLGGPEDSKYRHVYENFNDWYTTFYNKKLGKRCQVCLESSDVNITHPAQNRVRMYETASRCD